MSITPTREAKNRYKRAWEKRNPEKLTQQRRRYYLKKFYGLTMEDYDSLLATQNGVCAICCETCAVNSVLSVDHNHITGEVKGLLCFECNIGLGKFKDNINLLKRAVEYEEFHASK